MMPRARRSLVAALLLGSAACSSPPPPSAALAAPAAPAPAAAPCPPAAAAPAPPTEAELDAIHERLVTAYRTNDVPALDRLIPPDHIHNNVFGMIQGKQALLDDIRSGTLVFRAYEITSSRWFLGGDMAVATGTLRAEVERAGKAVPSQEFRFTRIFVRRGGEWLELLFHNTMIAAAGTGKGEAR